MAKKKKKKSAKPQLPAGAEACGWHDLKPTGLACPACGEGEIVPTRGRFGPMWACSERPRCSFWIGARPTGYVCTHRRGGKECGALLMEGTKTIPERCSDRECPNHMPHRLKA